MSWIDETISALSIAEDATNNFLDTSSAASDNSLPSAATTPVKKSKSLPTLSANYGTSKERKNSIVTKLLNMGPTAYGNMFDTYIVLPNSADLAANYSNVVDSLYNSFSTSKETKVVPLLDNAVFTTRIESVDVPPFQKSSYSHSFCGTKIEKGNSNWNNPESTSMTIRDDSFLYIFDLMKLISLTDSRHFELGKYDTIPNIIPKLSKITNGVCVVIRRSVDAKDRSTDKNYKMFDAFNSTNKNFNTADTINNRTYAGKDEWLIFDDVKFLGTDALKFERDSAGHISHSYEFIFKNFYREIGSYSLQGNS